MSESLSFGIFAKDQASGAFMRVSQSADKATKSFGAFSKAAGVLAGAAAAVGGVKMFGSMISEAREAQKVTKITEAIVKATGGAAKLTAEEVGKLAESISNKTAIDDEAIQTSANLLLTFKNVRNEVGKGNDIFSRATAAAADLSVAGFGSMDGAAKMLGKALNDPLKGISALGRAGVTFTADQKEQIKALVKNGETLKAQKVILQEVEAQVGGTAAAAASPIDRLKVVAGNLGEEIGTALLPTLERFAGFVTNRVIPMGRELFNLFKTGDFTGAFARAFNVEEDSGLVAFLLKVRSTAITVFTEVTGGIKAFAAAWKFNDGEVTSSGFPGFMERLGFAARRTFDFFRAEVLPRLIQFGGYVKNTIIPIVWQLAQNGLRRMSEILGTVRDAIADNRPQLEQLASGVQKLAKFVIEDLIPYLDKVGHTTLPVLKTAIGGAITSVGFFVDAFNKIKEPIRKALFFVWEKVSGFFGNLLEGSAKAFGWVPGLGDKLKTAAEDFATFRDDVNRALDGIDDEAVKVSTTFQKTQQRPGSAPNTFAGGGRVVGAGTGTSDSIPAWLSNGEYVVRADAVRKYGVDMLDHINAGRYANGGLAVQNRLPGTAAIKNVTSSIAREIGKQLAAMAPVGGPPGAVRSFRGVQLNQLTISRLLHAERLLGAAFHITQGSYSTRVAASGSTHAGGGAMDTNGPRGWGRAVSALRRAGFAAWHRTPAQGPWGHHIHSIGIGDSSASPAAKRQVRDFLRGGDGLGMASGGLVNLRQAFARGVLHRDVGGSLPPGTSLVQNNTGKNETVITEVARLRLNKTIEDLAVKIARLTGSFSRVTETIGKTVAHIQSLVQQRNEFSASTMSSFTGALFGSGTSVGDLKLRLDAQTNDARGFQKNLSVLRGKSKFFNTGLWNELAASSDYGAAAELAQMTPAQLLALSKSYLSRQTAAKNLGTYAGNARYGPAILNAQAQLIQQQNMEKAIIKALSKTRIAIVSLPGGRAYLTAATNG